MTPLEHAKTIHDFVISEIKRIDQDNHCADTNICLLVDELEDFVRTFFNKMMEIENGRNT